MLLRFASESMETHDGLLIHFVDWRTGRRWERSEFSLLDTAIFLNGAMVAGEAFGGDVAALADRLLDRVDWPRLVVRGRDGRELLALGWSPEMGLLSPADVRSSEMAMPYFLAIGSRTHAIDPKLWRNTEVVRGKVAGVEILNPGHPLFTSSYGLGWHDLKDRPEPDGADLWANARAAALANRAFCREQGERSRTFARAEGGWWGISAGDSPRGYVAPGPDPAALDGTVWPLGALASLPWAPDELKSDLARWHASPSWDRAHGRFGLVPFSLEQGWVADDLIGIDLGSFAVALANHRARTVWDLWGRHPVARNVHRLLGG